MKTKKPKAKFILQNGGGSYKLEIYLNENATDEQNRWTSVQGAIVYDFQLNDVKADLKKDGFNIEII